jgi:hypothetical protein
MIRAARTILLLGILLIGGACASQEKTPPASASASSPRDARSQQSPEPNAPITNTDPCATRLHDLSGRLLLYYTKHRNLPEKLDQLNEFEAFKDDPIPLICPVSQKLYVYRPDGFYLQDQKSMVLVYDPAPSHDRHRWVITVKDPQPFEPLITQVRPLPESLFILNPPPAR